MNWKIGRLARLIGTLALIVFVCYQAGFFTGQGLQRFSELWRSIDWLLVVVSFLVAFVQNVVSALKWRVVVLAKKLRGDLYQLLKYLYIGRLYNLILPTSMGGDVIRVYRLGRLNDNMERAAASVFVDRFTGTLLLLVLAGVAVLLSFRGSGYLFTMSLGFVFVVLAVLGWGAVDARFAALLKRLAGRMQNRFLSKVAEKFDAFQVSIRDLRGNRRFLLGLGAYSLLFYGFAVVNVWTSALAFDLNVSLVHMMMAVPIIMVVMNLPVSIGGLGLMEASFTLGFELLGYTAELGLTTALLMRAKTLIDAFVGGAFELADAAARR